MPGICSHLTEHVDVSYSSIGIWGHVIHRSKTSLALIYWTRDAVINANTPLSMSVTDLFQHHQNWLFAIVEIELDIYLFALLWLVVYFSGLIWLVVCLDLPDWLFVWTDLIGCLLVWTDLIGYSLVWADLIGCLLVWADLIGCSGVWADLIGCLGCLGWSNLFTCLCLSDGRRLCYVRVGDADSAFKRCMVVQGPVICSSSSTRQYIVVSTLANVNRYLTLFPS